MLPTWGADLSTSMSSSAQPGQTTYNINFQENGSSWMSFLSDINSLDSMSTLGFPGISVPWGQADLSFHLEILTTEFSSRNCILLSSTSSPSTQLPILHTIFPSPHIPHPPLSQKIKSTPQWFHLSSGKTQSIFSVKHVSMIANIFHMKAYDKAYVVYIWQTWLAITHISPWLILTITGQKDYHHKSANKKLVPRDQMTQLRAQSFR